jgi:catechol 2,3-dioxygenase-like lactoylglutathione lyase family enzyme
MSFNAIEIVSIPVTDQERAKVFYEQTLGFALLEDGPFGEGLRWVQLAPRKDDATSIALVNWFENMMPRALQGLVIGVDDINAKRQGLIANGVEVSEVDDTPWGKFASLSDLDGNGWTLHQK